MSKNPFARPPIDDFSLKAFEQVGEETKSFFDTMGTARQMLDEHPEISQTAVKMSNHFLTELAVNGAMDHNGMTWAIASAFCMGVQAERLGWFEEEKTDEPMEKEPAS